MKTVISPTDLYSLDFGKLREITKITELAGTKWVGFFEKDYLNKISNKPEKWTYAARKGNDNPVTVVIRDEKTNKYLFIAQPRIPNERIVLSFPAGMMQGKTSVDTATIEVKEETGYDVKTLSTASPLLPKSSGITTESDTMFTATVKMKQIPIPSQEETETIVSTWMTPHEFLYHANHLNPQKIMPESNAFYYMKGITDGYQQICDRMSGKPYISNFNRQIINDFCSVLK